MRRSHPLAARAAPTTAATRPPARVRLKAKQTKHQQAKAVSTPPPPPLPFHPSLSSPLVEESKTPVDLASPPPSPLPFARPLKAPNRKMADILKSIMHPKEVGAMLRLKFGGRIRPTPKQPLTLLAHTMSDIDFCYATLAKVSRSFAVVIQQLPECLKDAVCVFYLVLRGLDSVEDDMTLPLDRKLPLLLQFHELIQRDGWSIRDVGDGADYRVLLANFEKVIRIFKQLQPPYQVAIVDITRRMAAGMAEFATKTGQGCATIEAYNLYCHYVAGLVGHGLSALFSASGLEDARLKDEIRVSNSMGLFLQKTNIIRDYLEDLDQGRTWWPKQIWDQYATDLGWFKTHPTAPQALSCLNHMVNDALTHVPDCLDYLSRIRDPKVFEFCAIPQVMAIATLSEVYNNPRVFTSVVKVRKGLSCRMMLEASNVKQVSGWFIHFAEHMRAKVPPKARDVNAALTMTLLDRTRSLATSAAMSSSASSSSSSSSLTKKTRGSAAGNLTTAAGIPASAMRTASIFAWVMFIIATIYLISRYRARHADLGTDFVAHAHSSLRLNAYDYSALAGAFLALAYLFGFFGIHLM